MMFDLSGRVAVVIGGTSGIGLAIAQGLASCGAEVVPTSSVWQRVENVCDEFTPLPRVIQATDVTVRHSIEALHEAVHKEFGEPADILVNCAGITTRRRTTDMSTREWNAVLAVNLTGTLFACQVFGAAMVERGHGRIINVASLTAFVGMMEVAAYGASKAGVMALTQSLAVEWARHGVTVNALVPGVIQTPMNEKLISGTPRGLELMARTPMGRFGVPEDLAAAAVFLASNEARFVTGTSVVVDGGFLCNGVSS